MMANRWFFRRTLMIPQHRAFQLSTRNIQQRNFISFDILRFRCHNEKHHQKDFVNVFEIGHHYRSLFSFAAQLRLVTNGVCRHYHHQNRGVNVNIDSATSSSSSTCISYQACFHSGAKNLALKPLSWLLLCPSPKQQTRKFHQRKSTFRFFHRTYHTTASSLSSSLTMEQFLEKNSQSPVKSSRWNEDEIILELFSKRKNSNEEMNRVGKKFKNEMSKDKVTKIIVEGNIGSGKTTFLEIFDKECRLAGHQAMIIPEPVKLWRDVSGVNIFQLLADDPKRWSFTFQSYVQLTMLKIHEKMPTSGNVKLMERSLYSARYCFVENLMRKNLIQDFEYEVLNQWFESSIESVPVDAIIYLQTDPDVVYERIHRRGRPEESKLSLDYIRSLHELHEDWLIHKKFPVPAPVLTLDANKPLDEILPLYAEKTGSILENHFIESASVTSGSQ